jgi:glycerophosphoryl diester phosphodiesterase
MASFKKARETGAPGLELDIHCCATGELVVAHDDTFVRTAPAGENAGEKAIETLTLAEVRAMEVGAFFGASFRGEHPPLLEEVLEEFCPDLYIDIELKTRKTRDDPLPLRLAETIKALGRRADGALTVSSFNPFSLAAFKGRCPAIPTAVIWCADAEVPAVLRYGLGRFIAHCDYVKPIHRQVSALSGFCMTTMEGRPQVPWTVDDPDLARKLLTRGCAGIITNRPQDLLPLLRKSGGG